MALALPAKGNSFPDHSFFQSKQNFNIKATFEYVFTCFAHAAAAIEKTTRSCVRSKTLRKYFKLWGKLSSRAQCVRIPNYSQYILYSRLIWERRAYLALMITILKFQKIGLKSQLTGEVCQAFSSWTPKLCQDVSQFPSREDTDNWKIPLEFKLLSYIGAREEVT